MVYATRGYAIFVVRKKSIDADSRTAIIGMTKLLIGRCSRRPSIGRMIHVPPPPPPPPPTHRPIDVLTFSTDLFSFLFFLSEQRVNRRCFVVNFGNGSMHEHGHYSTTTPRREYAKSVRARDLLPSRSISRSFYLVELSPLLFCGLARQPRIARLARIFSLASETMQLASRKRESFLLYSFRWHFVTRKRASTNFLRSYSYPWIID